MLIELRVRNFRSFWQEQVLTYSPTPDRSHVETHTVQTASRAFPRLCTAAVLLGPNGSGKSNLLLALQTLQSLIARSTAFSSAQLAELYTPFLFAPHRGEPTSFQIDFMIAEVRYRYAFAYDAERICSESLHVYKTGKSQRWFARGYDRAHQHEVWAPFSQSLSGAREAWRKATRPTALFLTTAAQLNAHQLMPVAEWFEQCLDIILPRCLADPHRLAALVGDAEYKNNILRLLAAVGLPAMDVRLTDRGEDLLNGADAPSLSTGRKGLELPLIEFLHGDHTATDWIAGRHEAAGMQILFALFGHALSAIRHGRLLAIDEFDANVHPLIARYLVQLLNRPDESGNRAQVLLTSHNTTLMDLDLLRRDEIWLIQKDANGASQLAPLAVSRPRKHELVAKAYLKGRYGALPAIRA